MADFVEEVERGCVACQTGRFDGPTSNVDLEWIWGGLGRQSRMLWQLGLYVIGGNAGLDMGRKFRETTLLRIDFD